MRSILENSQLRARIDEHYAQVRSIRNDAARIGAVVKLVLAVFDAFYDELCQYPYRAKAAFEARDPRSSILVSAERLELYSRFVAEHGPRLLAAYPQLAQDEETWSAIDRLLCAEIEYRYEADIAFSFVHSLHRNITMSDWRPVAYSFPPPNDRRAMSRALGYVRLPIDGPIDAELIKKALAVLDFSAPFADLEGDCRKIIRRIAEMQEAGLFGAKAPVALELVDAGFYRELSAFLVGRWVRADAAVVPFVVALLHGESGICADALVYETADMHNLFSSALANFHVTTPLYYQTCVFLYSLMPRRPLGLHYSTIGFNHVGKVAALNEISQQMHRSGDVFRISPGAAGTVAIGFTFDSCTYHLKIIRDRPTNAYKWGEYPGSEAVIEKYRAVHAINRAGSMLDNVMYFNVRLQRSMFSAELLHCLATEARGSVYIDEDSVLVRALIAQFKVVPLPEYLESAGPAEKERIIENLGHCIRNNAATNIFNRDLDSRNYGVGRYGKVLLFDYDAVEKLTDVKIRTNLDLEPGEDTPPAWVFEEGTIFLPEELQHGMQLKDEYARRYFRRVNGDLMTVGYWLTMQEQLARGDVPPLIMYPDVCRL